MSEHEATLVPTAVGTATHWHWQCSCGKQSPRKADRVLVERRMNEHLEIKARQAQGCGKQGWQTEEKARKVLREALLSRVLAGNSRRREERVYQCTICYGRPWHLTSKTLQTASG